MSHKPILTLPQRWVYHLTYWNRTLCRMLIKSHVFHISKDVTPKVDANYNYRNCNFHLIKIDDKLIGIDTWDTLGPTADYQLEGLFKKSPLKDLSLLIKIQHYPCKFWDRFTKETGIPVKSWTIFPSTEFPLEYFQWENKEHQLDGLITGRNDRFGRQRWVDWCKDNPLFYTDAGYNKTLSYPDYLERLKQCKWGISLRGKHKNHDGKNRRECEFTSCGIPLAMNYTPHYSFPMVPGKDFYLIQQPSDLSKLHTVDPAPFALASQRLYKDYFSPVGMATTLLSLL